MDDLIKALTIFRKSGNPRCPTHCEHDVMQICGIKTDKVTEEDRIELKKLGFELGDPDGCGENCYNSYRFGRA